jgi:Coenzyme PQQ synthesis protein D (PqqD)
MSDIFAVPTDQVAARVMEGEAVVINLDSGVYVGLNRSGTVLWGLLETGPRSSRALADALAQAYGVSAQEVIVDVGFFLDGLEREGMLTAADGVGIPVEVVEDTGAYLAPMAERYESLDELMLSGE